MKKESSIHNTITVTPAQAGAHPSAYAGREMGPGLRRDDAHLSLNHFLKNTQGVAAIELALAMPFLFLLFIGSFEMTRYIQINQKLEKAVHTMADVVAQSETIDAVDLNNLVNAMDHIMAPYSFGTNGRLVITSIAKDDPNPAEVQWQYCSGGLAATSAIGSTGQTATLPNSFTLNDAEDIIIAEIFYNFEPIINQNIIGVGQISKFALYRPRLGALDNFNSNCSS